jgi:hypothetical protein
VKGGTVKIARYGSWKSPITSDLIVAQSVGLSEIRIDGRDIFWLESRPEEAGRNVVVRHAPGVASGAQDVLPKPFNARTRVHEYGGGAWNVAEKTLYFSKFADQRLYRLDAASGEPVPVSPKGAFRYADGLIDSQRQSWIGVREDHTIREREPENAIVRLDLNTPEAEGSRVVASGHDFYSSPRLSPDGRWLAYLAWDHPRMPWVGTTLYAAPLLSNGSPDGEPVKIAGGERESVFQPEWAPDGKTLYFISDRTGWWNLYRCDLKTMAIEAVAPMEAEFGRPQWVFGMAT